MPEQFYGNLEDDRDLEERGMSDEELAKKRQPGQPKPLDAIIPAYKATRDVGAGDPSTAPSPEEREQVMGQVRSLEEILGDEQQRAQMNEYTARQLEKAVEDAKQAYKEEADRNKWAGVGQAVARGLVQYMAASKGAGRVELSPGIDWQARTDRARRDYQDQLGEAEKKYGRSERMRGEALGLEKELARGAVRADTAEEKEADRERRRKEDEARRERERNAREDAKEAERSRKEQLADAIREEKAVAKQLTTQQNVVNRMLKEDDLDSKTLKKYKAQYPDLTAKAGLDLDELEVELENTDEPGKLWGTNENPEARKQVLKNKVEETRNLLNEIKRRKRELMGAPDREQQAEQPKLDPKIEEYSKQNNISYEAAQKVLEKRGYKPE